MTIGHLLQTISLALPACALTAGASLADAPFPIPDTMQNTCYDATQEIDCPAKGEAFHGQDDTLFGVNFADGRIKGYGLILHGRPKEFYVMYVRGPQGYGVPDLTDNGDGTITDAASGLMWTQDDNGEAISWEGALAHAQAMNAQGYLGHDDWRLPNIKELQSIVDYTRSPDTTGSAALDPLFDISAITNEAGTPDFPFYWSSTTHANVSDQPGAYASYVSFGRAMGYMNGWTDVHGAGAQRSDPKVAMQQATPKVRARRAMRSGC